MKGAKWLAISVLAVASAVTSRADWGEMRKGLDQQATLAAVGTPIIASQSRSRVHATWTYDSGGYIQFEQGRVAHWQAPRAMAGAALNAAAEGSAPVAAATAVAPAATTTRTQQAATRPATTRRYVIVR